MAQVTQAPPSVFIPQEEVDPGKFSFGVMIWDQWATPDLLAVLKPQVTTYREFTALPRMERMRVDEQVLPDKTLGDDWVYTHHQQAGNSMHLFTFVMMRTDVEAQTAIPALSYSTSDQFLWHDVLLSLNFVEDPAMPIEVVVDGKPVELPRVFPRMDRYSGGNFTTVFRVEMFVSHKPFKETQFRLDIPVPTPVSWALRNSSKNLGPCLHPKLVFPETQPRGRLLFGAGTVDVPYTFGQDTIIPATNHLNWRNHVCQENVQQVNGLYIMERRTAVVPRGRRREINAA